MKHKYKIRVDQPIPTDDQIDRHRNFDGLLSDYHNLTKPLYRRPLYKNPKTFIGLLFIIVVAILVFQAVEEEDKEEVTAEQVVDVEVQSFLNPPVQSLAAVAETKLVTPGMEVKFPLREGATLHIPASTFAGREHEIEIEVISYPKPLEAVLNGIPLQDHLGIDLSPLQMYAVRARCQGKEIDWDPKNPIWIEGESPLNSEEETATVFTLDMEKRKWHPVLDGMTLEKKLVKKPLSTHLDDGFGVVEIDKDGNQLAVDPTAQEQSSAVAEGVLIRRTQIEAPGLYLCGVQSSLGDADQLVEMISQDGKKHELQALYQVAEGTIRTAWVLAEGQFKVASSPCLLFGFLADGRPVRLDWEGKQELQSGAIPLVPEVAPAPVTGQKELEAFLFSGE